MRRDPQRCRRRQHRHRGHSRPPTGGAAANGATGVVVVSLSGALSATMQSAELAARSVADEIAVRVVDSRSVSWGSGRSRSRAARRAADGADRRRDHRARHRPRVADEGVRRARHAREPEEGRPHRRRQGAARDRARDQADHRGERRQGRAGRQAAHPLQGARVPRRQGARVRGSNVEPRRVSTPTAPTSTPFVDMLRPLYAGEIIVGDIGPVIGTHAGRGTIGVAFTESVE